MDSAIHLQGSGQCGAYTELQPFLTSLQSAANSRVHFEVAERNSILGSVAIRAKQLDDWLDAAEHRSQLMSRIRSELRDRACTQPFNPENSAAIEEVFIQL